MSDLLFLFLFQFILTIPVAWKIRSVRRYVLASIISLFGVAIPLLTFFASYFFIPPSKEHCPHGWLDCFNQGKLALAPLALWATAALYAVDILRVENRNRLWIVLGISFGAVISAACFIFMVLQVGFSGDWHWDGSSIIAALFLFWIPFYVAAWYSIRAVQLIRSAQVKPWVFMMSQIGSLPFWAATYYWCEQTYLSLPDKGDGCFIVTAAGRGHRSWVGPFVETTRRGRRVRVNLQLLTFWELESHWRTHLPYSHAVFRFFTIGLARSWPRKLNRPGRWISFVWR